MDGTGLARATRIVVEFLVALIGLGGLIAATGVLVRWLAFSMDSNLRGASFLATSLPPPDLALLGAQQIMSPVPILFGVLAIVAVLGGRRTMSRTRLFRRLGEVRQRVESRTHEIDDLIAEMSRELLNRSRDEQRIRRLQEDLAKLSTDSLADLENWKLTEQELDRIPDPSDGRHYEVDAFGVLFSSKRVFAVLVLPAALVMASWAIAADFPLTLVEQLTILVAGFVTLKAMFWRGEFRPGDIAAIAVCLFIGSIVPGVLGYQAPVGSYSWAPEAGLKPGLYALIGIDDHSTFVVSCDEQQDGVAAVPSSAILAARFAPPASKPRGPSLVDLFLVAGSWPDFGSLAACDR